MSLTTRVGLLAGATALTLTGVGAAASTDATTEQLRAQVEQLSARLAELEGRENWLTEQRATEIRGLVHDVLADADTRASLLGSGMQAGYEDGFTIGSPDGNFLLRINGQIQARWMWSYQSDIDDVGGDRHRSGFENTRTKLWFSGHVVNPQWQYVIEGDFNRADGLFDLLDAHLSYDYGNGIKITAGQFKLPFLREQLVDARYQQAVERSLVHQVYTVGRSQGLMVGFEQDMFRIFAAFSDGANQLNTPFSAGPAQGSTEWALTARGEVLLGGTWDQFAEFRSPPGEEMGILVGGAMHWQNTEYGTPDNTVESFAGTVDAHVKLGGINVFGAYIFDHTDVDGGGNFQDHAIVVQGGFHLTDAWELFGRWEHVWVDDNTDISIISGGVNHYWAGHQAKLTADVGYALKEVNFDGGRTGWRNDQGTDDGQLVFRTQLQLLF